jgi:hypothetical protein
LKQEDEEALNHHFTDYFFIAAKFLESAKKSAGRGEIESPFELPAPMLSETRKGTSKATWISKCS